MEKFVVVTKYIPLMQGKPIWILYRRPVAGTCEQVVSRLLHQLHVLSNRRLRHLEFGICLQEEKLKLQREIQQEEAAHPDNNDLIKTDFWIMWNYFIQNNLNNVY